MPIGNKSKEINSAAGANPKSGHMPPAKGNAGPERKADMAGAMDGSPTDGNPLRGAIQELGRQHPQKYSDHGPHHGTSDHIRHKPMKLG